MKAIDASQYRSTSSSRLRNIRVAKLLLDPNGRTPVIRHVACIRSGEKIKKNLKIFSCTSFVFKF